MAGIYVFSDQISLAAELISFAKQTGKTTIAFAFSQEAANELATKGADKVCLFNGDSPMIENYSEAVAAFLKKEEAELLVVGATARGRDFAARVAGYLDCGMASDVSSLSFVEGDVICERMHYGGIIVQSEILSGLSVVTVPAGKFDEGTGNCEITSIDLQSDSRVSLVETKPIVKEGADLNKADKVVCVGMGLEKPEDMEMAKGLAAVLDAEIACTRGIAEERHWLPVEQYIGISGAVIKPQLYLSFGVSGQMQHMFGVRDAKTIVAIDNNENAPIFKSADYGIVGDMYEIVPLLTAALK
ncbi:electron transfer flavoprotein subunit alpha/FixB family protein [Robertmurraya massiliosenegalensis]|uniref:electron transfer flavoprotein subunit alpha/FixB family protein n=1 Tax=Robertmurraya TaxID=2837507 RepID=UPI0039A5F479